MKFKVTAQSFDPATGLPKAAARDEIIDTVANILFSKCNSLLDVKQAYENFWNGMSDTPSELVFVQSVKCHVDPPAVVQRTTPTQHGGWRNKGCAVLPIGLVNLTTAKNGMFGTMWNGWSENAGSENLLLANGNGLWRALHTSGTMSDMLPGDIIVLKHDQTFANLGTWKIVSKHKHTPAGLLEMKTASKKSSVAFMTFK